RSGARVGIFVGSRRVLLWDGERVTTEDDAFRSVADRYVIDLRDVSGR
ncbi:MAG: hypothetical protein GWN07_04860, partial [Actinobacteria bacterium]|nr:hypothetical protein [Actinomycetota bacterium]NIX19199.1 hypothetical protein [Actinomycetota bacterium]